MSNTTDFIITKWCKSITDSGKDEYVNKGKATKEMTHKFRLLDDDDIVYAYGVCTKESFAPLNRYRSVCGCVTIQYRNETTKKYETL